MQGLVSGLGFTLGTDPIHLAFKGLSLEAQGQVNPSKLAF